MHLALVRPKKNEHTPHNDMHVHACIRLPAGTFHLLHMLVDDYIMHTLETMLEKEHEEIHLKRINLLRDGTSKGTSSCQFNYYVHM